MIVLLFNVVADRYNQANDRKRKSNDGNPVQGFCIVVFLSVCLKHKQLFFSHEAFPRLVFFISHTWFQKSTTVKFVPLR